MKFEPIKESEYPVDSPMSKNAAAKLIEIFNKLSKEEQEEFLFLSESGIY
jgi:hypothetical protein